MTTPGVRWTYSRQRVVVVQVEKQQSFWHQFCTRAISNVSGNYQTGEGDRSLMAPGRGGLVLVPELSQLGRLRSKLAETGGVFVQRAARRCRREKQVCGGYSGICAASGIFWREKAARCLLWSELAFTGAAGDCVLVAADTSACTS